MTETDRQLVERARAGDAQAFEQLVRRHLRAAFAVALAVVGEPADADDVCQDAFIGALEHLDDCRDPDRFRAWLLRIVRNRGHNRRRYHKRREALPLEYAGGIVGGASPARDAEIAELRRRLLDALDRLPAVQREIVLLHDLEGWRHREIGEALDLPEGTVRAHLSYARRELRTQLRAELHEEG